MTQYYKNICLPTLLTNAQARRPLPRPIIHLFKGAVAILSAHRCIYLGANADAILIFNDLGVTPSHLFIPIEASLNLI